MRSASVATGVGYRVNNSGRLRTFDVIKCLLEEPTLLGRVSDIALNLHADFSTDKLNRRLKCKHTIRSSTVDVV